MNLSHYSPNPVERVYSNERAQGVRSKPFGFWVSVDGEDDWKSWCEAESFSLGSLLYRHRVAVDESKLLHLKTKGELLDFTLEYGQARSYGLVDIDWSRVADKHAGIIIAPYQWSCRMDDRTFWYYGWDCASGCIWDVSAITDFREAA